MSRRLITANTWFGLSFMDFRRKILAPALQRHRLKDMGPDTVMKPLVAFVNAGRWSITCPNCGGGEYAFEEGWVMCRSCFNGYMGHKLRRVVFPTRADEIEQLLLVRPLQNRNWNLGETLAFLQEENEAHADELLTEAPRRGTRAAGPVVLSPIALKYGRPATTLVQGPCLECEDKALPPTDASTEPEVPLGEDGQPVPEVYRDEDIKEPQIEGEGGEQ